MDFSSFLDGTIVARESLSALWCDRESLRRLTYLASVKRTLSRTFDGQWLDVRPSRTAVRVELYKLFICRLFVSLKGRNSILLISLTTTNMLKFELDDVGRSRTIVIARSAKAPRTPFIGNARNSEMSVGFVNGKRCRSVDFISFNHRYVDREIINRM